MEMKLYTDEEISKLLERFGKFKMDDKSERVRLDYIAVTQSIAKIIDEFLEEHEKPQKTTFFGIFGSGDEE